MQSLSSLEHRQLLWTPFYLVLLQQFYQHFISGAGLSINVYNEKFGVKIPPLSFFFASEHSSWTSTGSVKFSSHKLPSNMMHWSWCVQRRNLFPICCLFEIFGDVQLYHCSLMEMFPNILSPDLCLNLSFSGKCCLSRNLQFLQSGVHLHKLLKGTERKIIPDADGPW